LTNIASQTVLFNKHPMGCEAQLA